MRQTNLVALSQFRDLLEGRITLDQYRSLPDTPTTKTVSAVLRIEMPLPSLANARLHWTAKARIKKSQRQAVALSWQAKRFSAHIPSAPWAVTLIRHGRKLDDDNLATAFKHVRDEVAKQLGVDDGDESMVRWEYRQEQGKPAIEIEIS